MARAQPKTDLFLNRDELYDLTGSRNIKVQITTLRKNHIPFYLNAAGRPIVAREAVIGKPNAAIPEPKPVWQPAILMNT